MKTLLDTTIRDWSIAERSDQDLTPEQRHNYQLKIEINEHTGQIALSLEDTAANGLGAELFIEINRGVPCVHVSDLIGGDNIAHLFVTRDGVVVLPDSDRTMMERIPSAAFYPGSRDTGVRFSDTEPVDVSIPVATV